MRIPWRIRRWGCILRWAFHSGTWQPTRSEWLMALRSVQPEEMRRIQNFAFQRDAKASVAGRLMLRSAARRLLASQNASFSNKQLHFERSAHGRPFLRSVCEQGDGQQEINLLDLDLNVSHQGDWTLLVAADKGCYRVGVDVMHVERPSGVSDLAEFFRTMRRQFSSSEWECIERGLNEKECMRRFYRHWCIKVCLLCGDAVQMLIVID